VDACAGGGFRRDVAILGESAEVIVAGRRRRFARTMTVVATEANQVIDTCGTGGDVSGTLNLSTPRLSSWPPAVPVAKHGNRSVSSRCGSADVIEALGIPIDVPPDRKRRVLSEAGIAFLFAPAHHPALRHAAQARRELGTRTIFNALGPLANPARATHQLVGVYDDALRTVFADALSKLGVGARLGRPERGRARRGEPLRADPRDRARRRSRARARRVARRLRPPSSGARVDRRGEMRRPTPRPSRAS
jgi:anthranilate phosphoribosyltransferase